MPYCPNCNAQLQSGHLQSGLCWNCEADFGMHSAWHPISSPTGPFRPFRRRPLKSTRPTLTEQPRKKLPLWLECLVLVFAGAFVILIAILTATGRFPASEECEGKGAWLCLLLNLLHSIGGPYLAALPIAIFGLFVLAAGISEWLLKRPRRVTPNPSIERTCPGKPGQASHLKR